MLLIDVPRPLHRVQIPGTMDDEVDWGADEPVDEWRRGAVSAGADDEDVMSLDGAEVDEEGE